MSRQTTDPKRIGALLARLLAVLEANRYSLPKEMLEQIDALSVEGVDPDWQVREMTRILDDWAPRH